MAESPPQIATTGSSDSGVKTKSVALNAFERFLAETPKYVIKFFRLLTAVILCEQTIWLEFAHHLVNKKKRNDEAEYKGGTVVEYLRKVINLARDRFGATNPDFFAVLDRSDDARNWLKGAIRQVNVQKFKEATANGDTMSAQAPPIYNSHRREIAKQLRLKGTAESIKRALVFQMNGVAAGRPGEVATMSVDSMTWDPLLLCVVTTWPQIKTHKNKLIAISAGADRLICPIMAFATAYAMGIFKDHVFEVDGLNYVFPELADCSSVSTAISKWLKAMVPGSPNVEYKMNQVAGLDKGACAAGQRVGSINEMAFNGVCAEFMAYLSGHDFENLSTLWHYLNPVLALLIPGVLVLTGWPALPYGQLGAGAKPASLEALSSYGVATQIELSPLVDELLNLRKEFSSPRLLEGGALRPFVLSMAATLIMYYEESKIAEEVPTVNLKMVHAMLEKKFALNAIDAQEKLKIWGKIIKDKRDLDNLPISSRAASGGHEQIIQCLQQLSSNLVELRERVRLTASTDDLIQAEMRKLIEGLSGKVNSFGFELASRGPSPRKRAAELISVTDPSTAVVLFAAPAPAATTPATTVDTIDIAPAQQPFLSLLNDTGAAAAVAAENIRAALGSAQKYYEMNLKGKAPSFPTSQNRSRAKMVVDCFNAVATAEDRASLKDESDLVVFRTTKNLHDSVIARMLLAFSESDPKIEAPKTLRDWKELSVNSLSDRLDNMKRLLPTKTPWTSRMTLPMPQDERKKLPKPPTRFFKAKKSK